MFLVVVNLGGATASLYGLGYGPHEREPRRVLPFFPAFLAGMNLVVLADDAFTFLLSWEFMSLTSWALVMAHHRETGNARAGYIYLLMASLGTLVVALWPLVFWRVPAAVMPSTRFAMRTVSTDVATAVLLLALLGAGSKAGLVPLHVWLPLAHPAAPSHVSALDERRDDQGRGVRLRSHHLRSDWERPPGGGARWCCSSEASPRCWAFCTR